MLRTPWSSGAGPGAGGRDLRPVESSGRGGPGPSVPAARPTGSAVMSWKLARPIALCVALTVPAMFLRLSGLDAGAASGLLVFGAAVAASSFLLAWAAEAARIDISGSLAIAILAVVAVLP